MNDEEGKQSLLQRLHSETALIGWRNLQRFFAQGRLMRVDDSLDLVGIAAAFAGNQVSELEPLLKKGKIAAPDDLMARQWYENESELWCVVVAPYVLVQEKVADSA